MRLAADFKNDGRLNQGFDWGAIDHTCGLSDKWNYSRGQFTQALILAKKNGRVKWADIAPDIEKLHQYGWYGAAAFNTTSCKVRAKFKVLTMAEYIRYIWNSPDNAKSPYKYFEGALFPDGTDSAGNLIYKYGGEIDA